MPKVSEPEPPQLGFGDGTADVLYLVGPPSSDGSFLGPDGKVLIDSLAIEVIPQEVAEELDEEPSPSPPPVSYP
jgi:hypothetical protein